MQNIFRRNATIHSALVSLDLMHLLIVLVTHSKTVRGEGIIRRDDNSV